MQAKDAVILWDDPNSDRPTAGQCLVVPLGQDDRRFPYSGGAANSVRRTLTGDTQLIHVLLDYIRLVVGYGLDPDVVFHEFNKIDEFRAELVDALSWGKKRPAA